jgi:hypothetical protein
MTYSWQDIQQDWLGDSLIAIAPDEAVAAFNGVMDKFGRDWVEASRTHGDGMARGVTPTLHIVTLGLMLRALNGAPNSHGLLEKLRNNQPDAWAELCAIYLLCSDSPEVSKEIEPEVVVGQRNRVPDIRARSGESPWTYVEVTMASRNSAAQREILNSLERLTCLVDNSTGSFALEIFLKREPNDEELGYVEQQVREGCQSTEAYEVELPSGLGALYWNHYAPGIAVIDDHGEPYRPGLGVMRTAVIDGQHRHIIVRWPFTDMRAEAMLTAEARQLPTDAPGLVMIQTSGAVGAMKAWRSLIERRLQPTMHTRVSAVCLFTSAIQPSESGEQWRPECKVIINPHARNPLPGWIANRLALFPSHEADLPT